MPWVRSSPSVDTGSLRCRRQARRVAPQVLAAIILAAAAAMAFAPTAIAQLKPPEVIESLTATATPSSVAPGQSFTVIVDLAIRPEVHIQAAEPLDPNLHATKLVAGPVEGIAWGQPKYPEPERHAYPGLGDVLEYAGKVRITLPGKVAPDARPGARQVALTLQYQGCNDRGMCFAPTSRRLDATLKIVPGDAAAAAEDASGDISAAAPEASSGVPAPPVAGVREGEPEQAKATAAEDAELPVSAHLPWQPFSSERLAELTASGKTVLIDFTADWCPNCKLNEAWALNTRETAELVRRNNVVPLLADFTRQDPVIQAWLGKFNSISVPLTVIVPGENPSQPIVLRDTYRQGTLLDALRQAGPSVDSAAGRSPLTLETPVTLDAIAGSIGWYLLAAFIGGLILNFMPCVLPVISIKVLSLVSQAGESRKRVFGLGVVFAAGMVFLFLVLGLLVTVVGQTWGALFQSTAFLVAMLGILVAMAASLFGAFTLTVPSAVGDADVAIEGEGYTASFGKGMLAVLLGTPCSGPFLGPVLAWSAAESATGRPYMGLLVFLMMGLGMAFPFVVLAAKPGWMKFLPRPGAWMETFKQAMAFLLLLTAVYILWLLRDQVMPALLFSVGVAFAAWLYGKLVQPGRSAGANWTGRGVAAAVVVLVVWGSFVAIPGALGPAGAPSDAAVASPAQAVTPAPEVVPSGQAVTPVQEVGQPGQPGSAGQQALPVREASAEFSS